MPSRSAQWMTAPRTGFAEILAHSAAPTTNRERPDGSRHRERPNQRPRLVCQRSTMALHNRRLLRALAVGTPIALIAFVAALQPQDPQQLPDAREVKLTSQQATIRAPFGPGTMPAAAGMMVAARVSDVVTGQSPSPAINGPTDAGPLVSQQFGVGTLADRLEGRGGGQVVEVDDDDSGDQDNDDWAQQQEEEQDEEEQQEQDELNEEQAQQALQQAEQEIQQSEQEAEEQNEQAEQQALQDEQQAGQ